jgi:hypothetical protein
MVTVNVPTAGAHELSVHAAPASKPVIVNSHLAGMVPAIHPPAQPRISGIQPDGAGAGAGAGAPPAKEEVLEFCEDVVEEIAEEALLPGAGAGAAGAGPMLPAEDDDFGGILLWLPWAELTLEPAEDEAQDGGTGLQSSVQSHPPAVQAHPEGMH